MASPLWRQILADVLCQGKDERASERARVGAALIAGMGIGAINGYDGAQRFALRFDALTAPNSQKAELYETHYRRFLDLYPRLKNWFFFEEGAVCYGSSPT
jgi:xylulokinase